MGEGFSKERGRVWVILERATELQHHEPPATLLRDRFHD